MKKYEILYKRISDEIQSGILAEGTRLLSIREEALVSGVSINTVVSAYELLSDQGLVIPKNRGGYYVRSGVLELTEKGIGKSPVLRERFESTAREAGERLDQLYERLLHIDSSFACAAPGRDILPVKELNSAASNLNDSWIEYETPEGDLRLRQRIALFNSEIDGSAESGDIVITNGATESLSIVLRSLLQPGDTVVVESPTYINFFHQLSPLGVNIIEIPVNSDGIDLDFLENTLKRHSIRMIIVQPNIQNPTGISMSEASKQKLISLAERFGVYLVQDDVYGDLIYQPFRQPNLSFYSEYPGIILVSSYSKSISPGLRVGWIRSHEYARLFTEEKLRSSMDTCRAAQAILASFIGTGIHRRHLQKIRKDLKSRVLEHLNFLAEILPEGSSVRMPSGGCLLWIVLPNGIDATKVFELSAGKGLIAAPGELFSSSSYYNNCLRLNAGEKLTKERSERLFVLGEVIKSNF